MDMLASEAPRHDTQLVPVQRDAPTRARPSRSDDARDAAAARGAASARFERWGDLMLAARDGDDRGFDTLLRELSAWLPKCYARHLPTVAAEDAAQETLLAIHLRRFSYDDRAPFGAWLHSIMRNKRMDWLRRQYRIPQGDPESDVAVEDHGCATRSAIVVARLLSQLTPSQASVIRLVKLHGASIAEASAATGQSASLVKVNIHRGLKRAGCLVNGEAT